MLECLRIQLDKKNVCDLKSVINDITNDENSCEKSMESEYNMLAYFVVIFVVACATKQIQLQVNEFR